MRYLLLALLAALLNLAADFVVGAEGLLVEADLHGRVAVLLVAAGQDLPQPRGRRLVGGIDNLEPGDP